MMFDIALGEFRGKVRELWQGISICTNSVNDTFAYISPCRHRMWRAVARCCVRYAGQKTHKLKDLHARLRMAHLFAGAASAGPL